MYKSEIMIKQSVHMLANNLLFQKFTYKFNRLATMKIKNSILAENETLSRIQGRGKGEAENRDSSFNLKLFWVHYKWFMSKKKKILEFIIRARDS